MIYYSVRCATLVFAPSFFSPEPFSHMNSRQSREKQVATLSEHALHYIGRLGLAGTSSSDGEFTGQLLSLVIPTGYVYFI